MPADKNTPFVIRNNLRPGDQKGVVGLHGLYHQEYGLDHTFESYVEGPLSQFAQRQSPRERIWLVDQDGRLKGSLAIVEYSSEEAQLRWLILHPDLRGLGLAQKLVQEALAFCRQSGYQSVFLWTIDFLTPATALYKSFGFELSESNSHRIWGLDLTEERYDLKLA